MRARSPIDRQWYHFMDKCMPFGDSINCSHFQHFSNAVAHIVRTRTGKDLVNYLDDYLFVTLLKLMCNAQIDLFLTICKKINFPVSMEKTFWASMCLVFLGLLIDMVAMTVSIPVDKIERGLKMINEVLDKKPAKCKVTLKQLQKICGFLNFLGRCIVPGRAFTRRLYTVTTVSDKAKQRAVKKLKSHHHIRVSMEMCLDLSMWKQFLQHPSVYCRPFIDFSKDVMAETINIFSDASHNWNLGMGATCHASWMYQMWDPVFVKDKEPSIAYLELYALTAGVIQWIHHFQNRRVTLFCDNQSMVSMVNTTTLSCKHCMILIRLLVLKCLVHNVRVFAMFVPSKENVFADMLSHNRIKRFK